MRTERILLGNSAGNFGITVFNRENMQGGKAKPSTDLLFDPSNFKMPEPGFDGNPFGGKINY